MQNPYQQNHYHLQQGLSDHLNLLLNYSLPLICVINHTLGTHSLGQAPSSSAHQ